MRAKVILVPYDSGHYRKRMGLGPERIFHSGLEGLLLRTGVEFDSEVILLENTYPMEISAGFELCRKVAVSVREGCESGNLPIVLSGNCMAAVGTVSGCSREKTGVVWFDAHGESTTPETTKSGFLDGMPISTLLGCAWQNLTKSIPGFAPVPGDRMVLFGARDLEPAERELLDGRGVLKLSCVDQLARHLGQASAQVARVYVHVDLDVLDPSVATANQWTPPGGITLQCLLEAIAAIRRQTRIAALGIASYDPAVDRGGCALEAALGVAESVLNSS
ncbi:MAG: arginase family protein [Acidobacteria bacterium]|nr:arginase family protein [Acidobacteriota bacterium]